MQHLKQIKRLAKYKLKGQNEFDVHSPFVYDFATKVLYETDSYYSYVLIENIRKKLLEDKRKIEIQDFGAGSKIFKSNKRKVSDICKHSVKPAKYAQLMFRMVNYFQPNTILELGTSLGITTAYMASAKRSSKVISIEGDPATHRLAVNTLKLTRVKNVELVNSTFDTGLQKTLNTIDQLDFVFIDGHHSKAPTLSYFETCLKKSHSETVFIFDDINWSEEMIEAWETIKKKEEVRITIDLHFMGIVFLREGIEKQDFVLNF